MVTHLKMKPRTITRRRVENALKYIKRGDRLSSNAQRTFCIELLNLMDEVETLTDEVETLTSEAEEVGKENDLLREEERGNR